MNSELCGLDIIDTDARLSDHFDIDWDLSGVEVDMFDAVLVFSDNVVLGVPPCKLLCFLAFGIDVLGMDLHIIQVLFRVEGVLSVPKRNEPISTERMELMAG